MKNGFNSSTKVDLANATHPKVDYNKQFIKMVRINLMLDDKGG